MKAVGLTATAIAAPRGVLAARGKGYSDVTESKDSVVLAARERFDEVLKQFPAIQKDDPFWKTKAGAKFLRAYTEPAAVRKHLHNHRDYEYAK